MALCGSREDAPCPDRAVMVLDTKTMDYSHLAMLVRCAGGKKIGWLNREN